MDFFNEIAMSDINTIASLLSIYATLIGVGMGIIKYIMNKTKQNKTKQNKIEFSASIANTLNTLFTEKVIIEKELKEDPIIICEEKYELSENLTRQGLKLYEKMKRENPEAPDDMHAILEKKYKDGLELECKKIKYHGVLGLRNFDKEGRAPVITANLLVFCNKTQQILLHQRSKKSKDCPGVLHIFGGGYMPIDEDEKRYKYNDEEGINGMGGGIFHTALREFAEEAFKGREQEIVSKYISVRPKMRVLLGQDLLNGYIQISYIGLDIEEKEIKDLNSNWEGKIKIINVKDLEEKFLNLDSDSKQPEVTTSGKAIVLAWLALNAPGWKHTKFGKYSSAKELFDKFIEERLNNSIK